MNHLELDHAGGVAVVEMGRGKVNAIEQTMVMELRSLLDRLRDDAETHSLVLTGRGKFFSFGFDVPHLYDLSKEEFAVFLTAFTDLYTALYMFPKPVVAAVNGHAIAGGCMLAIACDRRVMVEGKAKIALNEVTFGSLVFAGSVEILRRLAGQTNAEEILMTGKLYTPQEALDLGLVDKVAVADELIPQAIDEARRLGEGDPKAFAGIKRLLRDPVIEEMRRLESRSIREFVEQWYSPSTRELLKGVQIHG